MKRFFISFLSVGLILFNFSSCTKPANATSNPNTNPPSPPFSHVFSVDNKWECEIDGIKYSGTVDTSFLQITNTKYQDPDTVFLCIGTTKDKKANIHFRFPLKRRSDTVYNVAIQPSEALLIFDTLTTTGVLISNSPAQVSYTLDTLISNKLKVSFSGTLHDATLDGSLHTIIGGKFSCEFGKGDSEPKSFSFDNDSLKVAGYFLTAKLISNTLILDGLPYSPYGLQAFKLQIRTQAAL